MKKRFGALFLALALLCAPIFGTAAFAASPQVEGEKKLYFREQDGKMCYDPDKMQGGLYQFMDFRRMLPGGRYHDELKVENGCPTKTYDLYFQIIPRQQSEKADELLEKISMRITYNGGLLYEGKATGVDYGFTGPNLQTILFMGTYSPGREEVISVDLELDKDVDTSLAEVLSVIDWKFMVTESEEEIPDDPIPLDPAPPKTGENGAVKIVAVVMTGCVVFFSGLYIISVRRKKKNA